MARKILYTFNQNPEAIQVDHAQVKEVAIDIELPRAGDPRFAAKVNNFIINNSTAIIESGHDAQTIEKLWTDWEMVKEEAYAEDPAPNAHDWTS